MDFYLTDDGDIAVSHSGDIAMTPSPWRDDLQQAYVRALTEQGDFLLYPNLGASLSRLIGMPQSPHTGEFGKRLIEAALDREGRFTGRSYSVESVPTGPQTIRFDISIISGNREELRLSIEQDLTGV